MTGSRTLRLAAAVALAVGAVGAGAALAIGRGGHTSGDPLGPEPVTVVIRIHHSQFEPERLVVERGTRVAFVVVNGDPINHELIIGGPAVHARHRSGTEAVHPPVPGEVSVAPGERALTTFRFDERGEVVFACHLPGHFDYGMRGTIKVV